MFVKETDATFSVHRESLVSEAVYADEQTAIWNQVWLYVGHESEVPDTNDFRARDVGGRSIFFCRSSDDEVRVFLNVCSHRGAEVCRQRFGNAQRFTCVYHAWTYDNQGRLVTVPDEPSYADGFPKEDYGLTVPPRVGAYRGFVFLSYNPNVEPLEEYLAGARHYLDNVADQAEVMEVLPGTHEYGMKTNWKLLVENSADGYHGMPVHSTYFDYLKSQGDDISASSRYRVSSASDLGNGHAVTTRVTPMARAVARWAPSLGDEMKPLVEARYARLEERLGEQRASEVANTDYNLIVFPNLIVLNAMGVVLRTINPTAVDEVKARSWSLGPADQSAQERASMLEQCLLFFGPGGFATPDDNDMLESVQRGLRSWREAPWSDISKGLTKEHNDSRDEIQMRTFWREYDRRMSAPPGGRSDGD